MARQQLSGMLADNRQIPFASATAVIWLYDVVVRSNREVLTINGAIKGRIVPYGTKYFFAPAVEDFDLTVRHFDNSVYFPSVVNAVAVRGNARRDAQRRKHINDDVVFGNAAVWKSSLQKIRGGIEGRSYWVFHNRTT